MQCKLSFRLDSIITLLFRRQKPLELPVGSKTARDYVDCIVCDSDTDKHLMIIFEVSESSSHSQSRFLFAYLFNIRILIPLNRERMKPNGKMRRLEW
jgi:hypothetical protein